MIRRVLKIGRWVVDFLFATRGYDTDVVLAYLYDAGAPSYIIRDAEDLMLDCEYNCGFTYSKVLDYRFVNPRNHRAVVLIGPTSSGAEFADTLAHEIHHLAVAISKEMGYDLDGEGPAYLSGDTLREFIDVICELGCGHCNGY